MAIQVEVWGDYACFTRPEMKTERVSYDVMTPSAARGLLESIYWHPGLRWVIDRIHVCAPIRFTNIRRNEVKSTPDPSIIMSVSAAASVVYSAPSPAFVIFLKTCSTPKHTRNTRAYIRALTIQVFRFIVYMIPSSFIA